MANAKKLPSGNWRARVYSYTSADGTKHYESFTASTRTQAEMLASQFANSNERKRVANLTVKEAVANYLEANRNVLSPSTLDGYRKDAKSFEEINSFKIRKITSKDLQNFIASLIDKGLSPKTVKNRYGLLRTVLTFSGIEQDFKVHLPVVPRKPYFAPEDDQIATLYNEANHYMKIAISLAAFHSLRRGEICGLKYKDLKGNTLYVHSDVVKSADGKSWVHKEIPKTESSNRVLYLSEKELELIGSGHPEEYIVPLTPGTIGTNFYNLKKRVGVDIRFHDLRGYFASIAAALNISDTYLSHLGGWREGSQTLKRHYQKPIVSINEGYANKLNEYFDNMTQRVD